MLVEHEAPLGCAVGVGDGVGVRDAVGVLVGAVAHCPIFPGALHTCSTGQISDRQHTPLVQKPDVH